MKRYDLVEGSDLTEAKDGGLFFVKDVRKAVEHYCRERMQDLQQRRDRAVEQRRLMLRSGLNEAIQEVQRMQSDLLKLFPDDGQPAPYEEPARQGRDIFDAESEWCG